MRELNRIHLNGLRAVEAVGRLGSLQKAADELGVSVGAVSQQIIKAERQLGRALFDRAPRGLVPTAAGRAILPRLHAGFGELDAALALLRGGDQSVLVISVAPVFASKWLVPRLARFSRLHPEIRVRLDASIKLVSPDASDIDIAVRVGAGNWPGVAASFLMPQEVFPVCTPELAARLAEPRDLLSLPILRDVNSTLGWNIWLDQFGISEAELPEGHGFTDASLCLEAAMTGQGVMLAWQTLAHDALVSGRLVAPFPERAATGLGYWLVTSATRPKPRKVRAFERWIAEEVALTKAAE
ncbi:MAG: LysR substrate-binding domain-containing protein [Mesorhizobium sp.]|nr:LysR substrate-binding domain-containing protein [Mesorhizobium sp.]